MVNIGLTSILKRKRGPPGGLAGAPNPTHGLCSPGKQAQPTKNHENTAPAQAPALISKSPLWGALGSLTQVVAFPTGIAEVDVERALRGLL